MQWVGGRENLYCLIFWLRGKRTLYAQVSLYGLHRNVPHWGDPENFRPERFLLDGKVVQVDVFFLFLFLQKSELLSSHNFDKSELFSWHKFKSSRIHGCFHSPRANDVVLGSLWQSNATKRNCGNEEGIFRDTVFLMFSLVLQHFSLERCSQHKLPSLDSVGGLTIGPQEYWATIKRSM